MKLTFSFLHFIKNNRKKIERYLLFVFIFLIFVVLMSTIFFNQETDKFVTLTAYPGDMATRVKKHLGIKHENQIENAMRELDGKSEKTATDQEIKKQLMDLDKGNEPASATPSPTAKDNVRIGPKDLNNHRP